MKKLIFSKDPHEAAKAVVKIASNLTQMSNLEEMLMQSRNSVKRVLELIPAELAENPAFWLALMEHHECWISCIPENIRKNPSFLEKIDINRFWMNLPKKALTPEMYLEHKEYKGSTVYYNNIPIQCENGAFEWYVFGEYSKMQFYKNANETNANAIIELIELGYENSSTFGDMWSQRLVNSIWESGIWHKCYKDFPMEFVNPEVQSMIKLLEKRDTLGLVQYWCSFETVDEFETAFKLEHHIEYYTRGYAVSIQFVSNNDSSESYSELWNMLWDKLKIKNETIINGLVNLYPAFASAIPDNLFNEKWLTDELYSEIDCLLLEKPEEDASEVEMMEYQDLKSEITSDMISSVQRIRPNWSLEKATAFVHDYILANEE